jgi:hypothetical protein
MSYETAGQGYESDPAALVGGVIAAFDSLLGEREKRTLVDLSPDSVSPHRLLPADELPELPYTVLSRDRHGSFYRTETYVPGGPRSSGRPGFYGVATLYLVDGHFVDYHADMADYYTDEQPPVAREVLPGLGSAAIVHANGPEAVDAAAVSLSEDFPADALNNVRNTVAQLDRPTVYDRELLEAIAPYVPVGEDIRTFLKQ